MQIKLIFYCFIFIVQPMIYPYKFNESYIEGVIVHHRTCNGFLGQNIKKKISNIFLDGINVEP